MNQWLADGWRWLFVRFASAKNIRCGRRRRQQHSPFSYLAADVETLESRALLTVTYHGGALLANVETQAVYLGSDWQNTSTLKTQTGQVDTFLSTIVNSPYMDMMTNAGYNVGRGTSTAGVIDNITLNKSTGITDAQIQADIQAMIKSGQLQAPDANRLYVVYVEPGVVIHLGSDSSSTSFLGYHGAFGGQTAAGAAADIHYAVISYPGAPNFTASSQGFSSNFNEMTAVTSHELGEAVTDPNVNYKTLGWYDDQNNGEIGDLAEGHYATLSGYQVQDLVNKNDQIISPTTTQPPPPSSGLTAPVVTASAVNSTTAQLSWGAVSGATGYRVYQVVGTQNVLLGTVTATSVQVTGLTAGTKTSFMVEAYNSTTTADSQVVSVTTPSSTSQGLASPKLTVSALSSTSALLRWTSVSGAQGYRVYWSDGSQTQLLGSVNSRTTSVQVTGLQAGSTGYFLVEAYNGSRVGDSAWVSVTTPAARPADGVMTLAALSAGQNAGGSNSGGLNHSKHDDPFWFA